MYQWYCRKPVLVKYPERVKLFTEQQFGSILISEEQMSKSYTVLILYFMIWDQSKLTLISELAG